jgi:hypothetical protein
MGPQRQDIVKVSLAREVRREEFARKELYSRRLNTRPNPGALAIQEPDHHRAGPRPPPIGNSGTRATEFFRRGVLAAQILT